MANEPDIACAGPIVGDDGMGAVQLSLRPSDEWIYIERVGRNIQVWSGPACRRCRASARGLVRCQLHAAVKMIGIQYRLV